MKFIEDLKFVKIVMNTVLLEAEFAMVIGFIEYL
jgi:hypothetical protein